MCREGCRAVGGREQCKIGRQAGELTNLYFFGKNMIKEKERERENEIKGVLDI